MMAVENVNLGNVLREITLSVTVPKSTVFRMWLGTRLIKLAAFVMESGIKVETDGDG